MKFFYLAIACVFGFYNTQAQNLTTVGKVATQSNSYTISKTPGENTGYSLEIRNTANKFTNVKPIRSGYARDEAHIIPSVIFDIKRKDLEAILKSALDRKRWQTLADESLFVDCLVNDAGRVEDVLFYLRQNTKLTAVDLEKIENAFKTQFRAKITHPEFKGTFNYLTFGDRFTVKEILNP